MMLQRAAPQECGSNLPHTYIIVKSLRVPFTAGLSINGNAWQGPGGLCSMLRSWTTSSLSLLRRQKCANANPLERKLRSIGDFSMRPASNPANDPKRKKTSTDMAVYLLTVVVGMVGFTYASVPLYRLFCQSTGYGGTVRVGESVEEKLRKRAEQPNLEIEAAAAARTITVSFASNVVDGMPWTFEPTQRFVKVKPGQSTLAFYRARNTSDKSITGVSTYNVIPFQAAYYFNKIQCFCFENQKLRPGEEIDMPVFFYIDPEFAVDPKMKKTDHLTLSYTFFKVDEEDVEAEENQGQAETNKTDLTVRKVA